MSAPLARVVAGRLHAAYVHASDDERAELVAQLDRVRLWNAAVYARARANAAAAAARAAKREVIRR